MQAGKLRTRWATFIFPGMRALGAAVLLTHNHAPSDTAEDLLASLSHTPSLYWERLLGGSAGWSCGCLRAAPLKSQATSGRSSCPLPAWSCSTTGRSDLQLDCRTLQQGSKPAMRWC